MLSAGDAEKGQLKACAEDVATLSRCIINDVGCNLTQLQIVTLSCGSRNREIRLKSVGLAPAICCRYVTKKRGP